MSVPPTDNSSQSNQVDHPRRPKNLGQERDSVLARYKRLSRNTEKGIKRQLKHLRIQSILLLGFGVALIVGCLGIYVVVPRWAYGDPLSVDQWGAIEGFAALATFAFGVTAGLFVVLELMEASDSRNLEIYQDIYEKFMSTKQIEARRFIYSQIPDDLSGQELSDFIRQYSEDHPPQEGELSAHDQVKSVLNAIDYFGFLAQQDWVTADEMIGWVSPIVVKVWEKIGLLVAYEIEQRPNEPDYYEAAVELARKCFEWRLENIPDKIRARAAFTEFERYTEFDESRF